MAWVDTDLDWQHIDSLIPCDDAPYVNYERASVPGGWLVRAITYTWNHSIMGTALTFVPEVKENTP